MTNKTYIDILPEFLNNLKLLVRLGHLIYYAKEKFRTFSRIFNLVDMGGSKWYA